MFYFVVQMGSAREQAEAAKHRLKVMYAEYQTRKGERESLREQFQVCFCFSLVIFLARMCLAHVFCCMFVTRWVF